MTPALLGIAIIVTLIFGALISSAHQRAIERREWSKIKNRVDPVFGDRPKQ